MSVYRLARSRRVLRWWVWASVVVWLALAPLIVQRDGTSGIVAAVVGLLIAAAYAATIERLPQAIEVTEAGIRFRTRWNSHLVAWRDLRAVNDMRTRIPRLRWVCAGGDATTWNGYERQAELFHELMRRAPNLEALP